MTRRTGTTNNADVAEGRAHGEAAASPVSDEQQRSPNGTLADATELVPGWLALLVLVLLLAVSALGGYLLRGAIIDSKAVTPQEFAVRELEDDVKDDPENPDNQLALGYAYQQEGRYEDALERYEQVLQADPGNTGALYNKGVVLMTVGQPKEAEAVLWDLLEVAPDHVLAAKALGEYYVAKKHYKSALVALEPVIVQQPEYSDLQYLAGYSCEMLDLRPKAIEYYRGALKYNPDNVEAKDGLARLGESQ
ncbi:MAG: tetratricopeptide repeat protein [Coriobacteriia bacterium]